MRVVGSRGLRRTMPGLVVAALFASAGVASASRPPNTAVGGGYAALTVGQATVHGKRASLSVSCSGTPGATCFVMITMYVRETAKGRVITTPAPRRHRHIKLVDVGGTTESDPVGRSDTVPLPLYANGERLLRRHHPLPVKITVQSPHFKLIGSVTVTFGT
jgi:hypothetical protein